MVGCAKDIFFTNFMKSFGEIAADDIEDHEQVGEGLGSVVCLVDRIALVFKEGEKSAEVIRVIIGLRVR